MEIRLMQETDLGQMLEIRNDPETYNYLHTQTTFTLDEAMIWFKNKKPYWYVIIIDNIIVGYIRTSEHNFIDKSIWIGCDIHKDHRRKGYAFQAYTQFIDSLKRRGWNTIHLSVLKTNIRAFSLYKKLGFETYSESYNSYNMKLVINSILNTGRGVKVIACYFGDRRSTSTAGRGPHNAKEAYNLYKYIWDRELKLDQGYPHDTLFIHNKLLPTDVTSTPDHVKICIDLLNSFDNRKTANGVARVITRDNVGISFGAFAHAFDYYRHNYDFWQFTEDDQIIFGENVYIEALRQLMLPTDKIVGFVATVGVNREWGPCAMGACGISSREILTSILPRHFSPYYNKHTLPFKYVQNLSNGIQTNNGHEGEGEVMFTQHINDIGWYLAEHNFDSINVSWQDYDKRTRNCKPYENYMGNYAKEDIGTIEDIEKLKTKIIGSWKQSNSEDTFNILENNDCTFNSIINGTLHITSSSIKIIWTNGVEYNIILDSVDDNILNIKNNSGDTFFAKKI